MDSRDFAIVANAYLEDDGCRANHCEVRTRSGRRRNWGERYNMCKGVSSKSRDLSEQLCHIGFEIKWVSKLGVGAKSRCTL